MVEVTQTFAALTLTEFVPVLGIFAGMLVAFYALVKYLLERLEKSQENDRKERQTILVQLTDSINRMASASEKAATEAEQRNGHLAEISNQNRDIIIKAVSNVKEQHVKKQTVEQEIVKNKE